MDRINEHIYARNIKSAKDLIDINKQLIDDESGKSPNEKFQNASLILNKRIGFICEY